MVTQAESMDGSKAATMVAPALVFDGGWKWKEVDVLDTSHLPSKCYMFIERNSYPRPIDSKKDIEQIKLERTEEQQGREEMRKRILEPYHVPQILLSDTCTDLNGYFGSRSSHEEPRSHNTWLRCLAKVVWLPHEMHKKPPGGADSRSTAGFLINWFRRFSKSRPSDGPQKKEKDYKWYEMGVFTHWDRSGACRLLCIDTPKYFRTALHAALTSSEPDPDDPFALLMPLIDELVTLSDKTVWRVRGGVREVEKNRMKARPNFERMQEISRHAIHVKEALTVMANLLNKVLQDAKQVYCDLDTKKATAEPAISRLQLQIQIVESLKERSISTLERLNTEITLAYNIIVQEDNSVVKSIAWVTMTFLPATFVSAFFSTTFFSFSDGGWGGVSKIWLYWVVAIPATIIILIIFRAWVAASKPGLVRGTPKKHRERDCEAL